MRSSVLHSSVPVFSAAANLPQWSALLTQIANARTLNTKVELRNYVLRRIKAPKNITLLSLPSRAPELNPQENIWQFMRATWLSNRFFKSFGDIVDHCCYAWNTSAGEDPEGASRLERSQYRSNRGRIPVLSG
jgi:hypothetical protein